MKRNRINLKTTAAIFLLLIPLMLSAVISSYAESAVTSTVNIAAANQNIHGIGYEWNNRTSELVLDNVNIKTGDMYALKLPRDCTVILNGTNYISAAEYGVACAGNVIFKGNGKLIVKAGKTGLFLTTQDSSQKVSLIDGDYEITAGEYGVFSDAATFAFLADSLIINVSGDDGYAVYGKKVSILGGIFKSDTPLFASRSLNIESVNIDIDAESAVFTGNNISIKNIKFDTFDEYSGETSVSGRAIDEPGKYSIVFGSKVGSWIDYVILAVLVTGVVLGIAGPVVRQRNKAKKIASVKR